MSSTLHRQTLTVDRTLERSTNWELAEHHDLDVPGFEGGDAGGGTDNDPIPFPDPDDEHGTASY